MPQLTFGDVDTKKVSYRTLRDHFVRVQVDCFVAYGHVYVRGWDPMVDLDARCSLLLLLLSTPIKQLGLCCAPPGLMPFCLLVRNGHAEMASNARSTIRSVRSLSAVDKSTSTAL